MKRISILFSSLFFVSTAVTSALTFDTLPAIAEPSCGSGSTAYLLSIISPVGSNQFKVACDEHDVCYDAPGKSQQECDKAFHNRMLDRCARDHNTIAGIILRKACNGRADAYYAGVRKYGGDAYRKAQASKSNTCSNNNIEIRPTTTNLEFGPGKEWVTCSGYKFVFQNDRNLVLYNPSNSPLWNTGTNNRADLFIVQADGNIVLYGGGTAVWSAGTHNNPGAFLAIQSDGNVVVYSRNGNPIWATNTRGR